MGPCLLIFLHGGHHPRHLLYTDCPASLLPLLVQWAYTSSFYDTVGLYSIYLPSGYHPRHLLYTNCIASFPPLLHQWAHTSSFMTEWAYTLSFSYTVSTNLAIYCTQTVQPYFFLTCTVGPYLLIYDTVGLYPLIYLHSGHHPSRLLDTNCPASVPPLFAQWAHTSSFSYTVGTTLAIYCTQSVQPHFLPYFHSGSIPPHVLISGPIPPHFLIQWAPPSPSTVHRLSSLTSPFTSTVVPYLLILGHSRPILTQ